jgi:hypothetical protein
VGRIDKGAYGAILRTRAAYRFDIGTLLMRLFSYTITVGTIAMLTLAGATALEATSVASLIAVCMFFVVPRVSKKIDERGQSAIVPGAAAIAIAGFALLIVTTHFGLPFWLNYVAAPLISFLPNAQALARTRWAYVIETWSDETREAPSLKTAYAFEGVLEDIAFMVGPAFVIALGAALFPVAGMLAGTVIYCVGTALLISSRETEPTPGWGAAAPEPGRASVLRTSSVVRVLFIVMVLYGAMFGAFDTAVVSFCEDIGIAVLASVVFAAESICSVVVSILFGMLRITSPLWRQFTAFTMLFGCLYGLLVLVGSPVSLVGISCLAALGYPPMYITINLTCEKAVPSVNLTEALSWIASGVSIGMVIGPLAAGAVVDNLGSLAGFDLTGAFGFAVVIVVLACIPLMRKRLPR